MSFCVTTALLCCWSPFAFRRNIKLLSVSTCVAGGGGTNLIKMLSPVGFLYTTRETTTPTCLWLHPTQGQIAEFVCFLTRTLSAILLGISSSPMRKRKIWKFNYFYRQKATSWHFLRFSLAMVGSHSKVLFWCEYYALHYLQNSARCIMRCHNVAKSHYLPRI